MGGCCNGLFSAYVPCWYLRLKCNDVHMSFLSPLPGQGCDGDPDIQQETCLGIKDAHPPQRDPVCAAYRFPDNNDITSGSLANDSQDLITERWICNLQVYTLQALPPFRDTDRWRVK